MMDRRIKRAAALLLAAAALAACGKKDDVSPEQREAQARQDSARSTAKALQDSGVAVDTQKVDTGTTSAQPAQDN
jgi:ABC-type proline/glycine betaine transport system substrate-binding protein